MDVVVSNFGHEINNNVTSRLHSNDSGGDEFDSEFWYRHSAPVIAFLCVAYSAVFVLGLLGNSFVVSVVFRAPRMKTVTNYFIVNLALADILVLVFCLPATLLANIFVPWVLGSFMCKTVSYLQGVSVSASVNTLVAISVDRFIAICFPLKCQMTTSIARRIIVLIWIFSLSITAPWAIYFGLEPAWEDAAFCKERWPHKDAERAYFFAANLLLCYLLPLLFIGACYIGIWMKVRNRSIPGETKGTNAESLMEKSKLKVVKMMVIVVVSFVLSWLPLYIIFSMLKLDITFDEDSWEEKMFAIMVPVAQWLGASNSCINPVLYTFCNKKFRRGFLAIIKSRSCCGTLRYETTHRGTKSTVLRSTFKSQSRCDTQTEYITSAQV